MTTLHICIALAAMAPLGCWRPRRRTDPGRRSVVLLVAANLLLVYGIGVYLADAGYVGHFLICVLGLPLGGTL